MTELSAAVDGRRPSSADSNRQPPFATRRATADPDSVARLGPAKGWTPETAAEHPQGAAAGFFSVDRDGESVV